MTWLSDELSIATVDNGVITAAGAGTATITVTTSDGSHTATVVVTVTAAPIETISVTSVSVDESIVSIVDGLTTTVVATVSPANATDNSVTWLSDEPSIATVDNGVITAAGAGTATITVTTSDGPYTATVAVTVTAAPSVPQLISTTVTPTASESETIWTTPGGDVGNLSRMTDGNKLTTGIHPDAPDLNNERQIAMRRADGVAITFTFNSTYNNGKFIYYNAIGSNQVDGSTIAFMLEGVVQESFVAGAGLPHGGNTHVLEIEFIPSMNIQFDAVVLTFSGNWQAMRELEVFGIPVL